MQRMKLFHGSSNPDLARAVARYLGVPAGRARVARFSDADIQIEIE
jgi:ribose-phosphate pyrophosphokinase